MMLLVLVLAALTSQSVFFPSQHFLAALQLPRSPAVSLGQHHQHQAGGVGGTPEWVTLIGPAPSRLNSDHGVAPPALLCHNDATEWGLGALSCVFMA